MQHISYGKISKGWTFLNLMSELKLQNNVLTYSIQVILQSAISVCSCTVSMSLFNYSKESAFTGVSASINTFAMTIHFCDTANWAIKFVNQYTALAFLNVFIHSNWDALAWHREQSWNRIRWQTVTKTWCYSDLVWLILLALLYAKLITMKAIHLLSCASLSKIKTLLLLCVGRDPQLSRTWKSGV